MTYSSEQYALDFELLQATHANRSLYDPVVRVDHLKRLRRALVKSSEEVYEALLKDLCKSREQSLILEVASILHELDYMISNTKRLSARRFEKRNLMSLTTSRWVQPEPIGPALVIVPFNYPFQLSMGPLIGNIVTGNPVMLKFSAATPCLAAAIQQIILEAEIPSSVVQVYKGTNSQIFQQTYALVVFTGSTKTGREIGIQCAKTFTRCILELGGANPMLVDESADLRSVAQAVNLIKFSNSGQTCISPNYCVFLGSDVKFNEFVQKIRDELDRIRPQVDSVRVISKQKYEECEALTANHRILYHVNVEKDPEQRIFPFTLIEANLREEFLLEEIFGPVLPIVRVESFNEFMGFLKQNYQGQKRPLSATIYSANQTQIERFRTHISAGAICINQVMNYMGSSLPFGGIAESGMGCYHGRHSFDQFSHLKPVSYTPSTAPSMAFDRIIGKVMAAPYDLKLPMCCILGVMPGINCVPVGIALLMAACFVLGFLIAWFM